MTDAAEPGTSATEGSDQEHFRPTGTIFILVCYVVAVILLWVSVYVILLSRGVTA